MVWATDAGLVSNKSKAKQSKASFDDLSSETNLESAAQARSTLRETVLMKM